MPGPMANGAPSWDGQVTKLRDFLWHLDRLFALSNITGDLEKVQWAVSYVSPSIRDEWTSFEEYITPNWKTFNQRLKREYPEIVAEEQGSVTGLELLERQYQHISIYDEDRLLAFKRKFSAMAKKCVDNAIAPAIVTNRELVARFVRSLDKNFQESLSTRLMINGKPRSTTTASTVRTDDPYDWEEVVAKAVELVSGKTISKAMHLDSNPDTMSRAAPPQIKREPVERSLEQSDLREELASLKDTIAVTQKNMQSYMDSFKSTLQTKLVRPPNQSNYAQGQQRQNNDAGSANNRGCFYCFDPRHRWIVCPEKEQDVKDGKIKVEGNNLRFADGSPIPRMEGMSIKATVAKYLPTSLTAWFGIQPELPQEEEMPNLGGHMPAYGRVPEISIYTNQLKDTRDSLIEESRQALDKRGLELTDLRGRVRTLESMITKTKTRKAKEPEPSSEEEDAPDELAVQLAKVLALAQKKENARKTRSDF
jgi:hypothetical protein